MAADCLVCRELSGDVPVPGGMLVDEEHALAFHVPPLPGRGDPYLGHLDEWDGARHGGAGEVAAFAERLRASR